MFPLPQPTYSPLDQQPGLPHPAQFRTLFSWRHLERNPPTLPPCSRYTLHTSGLTILTALSEQARIQNKDFGSPQSQVPLPDPLPQVSCQTRRHSGGNKQILHLSTTNRIASGLNTTVTQRALLPSAHQLATPNISKPTRYLNERHFTNTTEKSQNC